MPPPEATALKGPSFVAVAVEEGTMLVCVVMLVVVLEMTVMTVVVVVSGVEVVLARYCREPVSKARPSSGSATLPRRWTW